MLRPLFLSINILTQSDNYRDGVLKTGHNSYGFLTVSAAYWQTKTTDSNLPVVFLMPIN